MAQEQGSGGGGGITPVGGSEKVFVPETAPTLTEQNEYLLDQGLVDNFNQAKGDRAVGKSNFSANRTAQLAQLDISKRRLEFQQKTGLRDIKQARVQGLKGAINNALQRGIFKSGIRKDNVNLVNRESDEARDDLKADIALSLESLQAQKKGVSAQKFGGSGLAGGSGFGLMTPQQMHDLSVGKLEAAQEKFGVAESGRAGQAFRDSERSGGTGIIAPANKYTGGGGL